MGARDRQRLGAQLQVAASPLLSPPFMPIQLEPPRTAFNLVIRHALVARLLASTAPLVLVSAPAGSGTTTLLLQWAERDARPQAWLRIDVTHNDPLVLATSFAAALKRVAPVDSRIPRWAGLVGPPLRERIVPSLRASLEKASPFLFVLDDAQLLTNKASWEIVETLLHAFPPGVQLAVGTRTEPRLPVARLAAAGRVLEIGGSDLAFSTRETAELLELRGLDVDEGTAAALRGATEGWAAGISLAALGYDETASTSEWVDAIHGDQRAIARYLTHEVLERQARRVRSFLLETSILERLSEGLCRAVTGRTDAGHLLARIERDSLFVSALDGTGEWYRYHQLFAELLQAELRRRDGARVPELHRRAAAWFEGRSEFDAAVRHWLAAGEVMRAAQTICRAFFLFASPARMETICRWLELFTDEQIRSSADLTLIAGWVADMSAESPRGRKWRKLALSEPMDDSPLLCGGGTHRAFQALLRAVVGHDGVTAMRKDAELAAELGSGSHPGWRAAIALHLGAACGLSGDDLGAEKWLRRAIEEGCSSGVVGEIGAMGAMGYLSLLLADRGCWEEAEILAARAAEHYKESEPGLVGVLVAVPLAQVRVLAHRHSPQAEGQLEAVEVVLARGGMIPWLELSTKVILARVALERGDLTSAERWTAAGMATLRTWPDAGILSSRLERLQRALQERRLAGHLTPMEQRVLDLLATHLTLREIGRRLLVSPNTLKTHVRSLYRKLDAHSRTGAVERARELGLLSS